MPKLRITQVKDAFEIAQDRSIRRATCERILKLQKEAGRILSASKYNAHTEPLFKNLKLLKIEHILKLHSIETLL